MQSSIKLISGEEISKFSTLVRRQEGKLGAGDLVKLSPHVYRDYIQKIKHFAGRTSKQQSIVTQKEESQQNLHNHPIRSSSALALRSGSQNPSYYYSKDLEIMSMKEFIVFLEQSKRKQQSQQRVQSRIREKQFVREVDRRIQSSHSKRNLRLTSSSANRISQRMKQIKYEGIYDK